MNPWCTNVKYTKHIRKTYLSLHIKIVNYLNHIINYFDLQNISLNYSWILTKINQSLDDEENLSKFKRIQIIQSMFPDTSVIKLEISNRKMSW